MHPYLQLCISIVLTAAAQILLKIGVDVQVGAPLYGFLVSLWIWAGVCAILASLFSWLYALKFVPLIVAFNLAATNHILVAIGAWAFLGEKITQQRWLGISNGCAWGLFYCSAVGSGGGAAVTFLLFCLVLLSGTCSVAGQIFLKHAMSNHVSSRKPRRILDLAAGVLAMTVGFFTWLTLLQRLNLSYLYPRRTR